MKSKRYLWIVMMLSTILLTACGGGGGGSGGNNLPGLGSLSSGDNYLFYTDSLNAVGPTTPGRLNAVAPANPASPIAVEPGNDFISGTARAIRIGTYRSTTQTVTDIHLHALIYAKTNGNFYRVSALKSGSLTPVRVSSENAADQLCTNVNGRILLDGRTVVPDIANPDNSQYVYSLPGIDSMCGTSDDVWKMVRLGMSASDAPIAAKLPVTVLGDENTRAITGWLVNDAGALMHCDVNFSNCGASVMAVATDANVLLGLDASGRYLMEIDDQLFVYDTNARVMSSSLFTIATGTSMEAPPATDGNTVYISYNDTIYQFPADGSAVATVLVGPEIDNISRIESTVNKVIYQVGTEIKVIDKTGGAASSLTSVATNHNLFFFLSGNYIYYSSQKLPQQPALSFTNRIAGIVDENGGNRTEFTDATWGGFIFSNSSDLSKAINLLDDMVEIILVQGSSDSLSGATLKLFDAATATEKLTLGTLPIADDFIAFTCAGSVGDVLCSAVVNIIPAPAPALPSFPFQTDIFILNTTTVNSLRRVTDTQDISEGQVLFN